MELIEVEIIKMELPGKQEGLVSFFHYRKQCIFTHKENLTQSLEQRSGTDLHTL